MKVLKVKYFLKIKKLLNKNMEAFSLIELSFVLVIVGVLMGAVFKGQELIEQAKIHSVSSEVQQIKIGIQTYLETYNALPGDDSKATERFGSDVSSGNGNGIIDANEAQNLWIHLFKAGDASSQVPPKSKLGGQYTIVYQPFDDMPGHWIKLASEDGSAILTPKQAQKMMMKIDGPGVGDNPNNGVVRIKNAGNNESCITNNTLNISNNQKSCLIFIKVS